MAAIEKVCEYSGEYGSYDMYDWKRNSIQIMPKYRKEFRGKVAVLKFIEQDEFDRELDMFDYVLEVPDMPGRVHGFYFNSYQRRGKQTVIRKMKRLVGARNLIIVPGLVSR